MTQPALMRRPGGHKVANEELFFDLIYVFLVTQVSHGLLHHLTWIGALQMLVLWFAAWLGWQYTGWVTNWFDPRLPALRTTLFGTMALALLCGAALPEAFGERGLAFALCYVTMQVGRSAFVVLNLPSSSPLAANYRRIFGWGLIAAVFWIAGALCAPSERLLLWAIGVLCEYVSPMFGFWLPGLGRSRTTDWTISGSHLVERCQLFVIVALGETIMASGLSMAETSAWSAIELVAFASSFLCTIAMWWLYFDTSTEDAEHAMACSTDPGRIGALFHYLHAILIGGIIVTAVGMDILLENPTEHAEVASRLVLTLGPALYLAGSTLYQWVSIGRIPRVQGSAVAVLTLLACFWPPTPLWILAGAETLFLLAIGALVGQGRKYRISKIRKA